MSKLYLLCGLAILLMGCEILKLPFTFAAGVIEAIPKLLMISDAGNPGNKGMATDEQPLPFPAAIDPGIDNQPLPDGYRLLCDYLQQHQRKVEVAIVDLQDGKAWEQIRRHYSRMQRHGAVSCFLVDGRSLCQQQKLAGIKHEIGRRGGYFYGELDE